MSGNTDDSADEMAEYLQTFLDETEEQLDDLVETMLALELDADNANDLNEAFRLIHSIKGSAGMMGFDSITVLTHHLENRFERFRSGLARLDEPTTSLVLRCIDFLRQCNNRLRDGQQLASAPELLAELNRLDEQASVSGATETNSPPAMQASSVAVGGLEDTAADPSALGSSVADFGDETLRMVIRFQAGLQLADLKAQLIVNRLAGLGDVKSTFPDLEHAAEIEALEEFTVWIEAHADIEQLRTAADVDGVEAIEFPAVPAVPAGQSAVVEATEFSQANQFPTEGSASEVAGLPTDVVTEQAVEEETPQPLSQAVQLESDEAPQLLPQSQPEETQPAQPTGALSAERSENLAAVEKAPPAADKASTKVAETMRVDIDRLDNLMNLAGELVVNRARLVQISGQVSPAIRKASMLNRVRDFSESLQRTIASLEASNSERSEWSKQIQQLRAGLELLREQADIWHNGRQCFGQISEAIDQLTRVSHNLQRGVLDTRMVPVGPLFNRFKRVVRDLSTSSGKKVNLLTRGEKTELDKRMIDELGDPLVHLVRNSLDHGMEFPEVRIRRGKPEVGTITLEAMHSGNNVYIHVSDDGGGIDVDRIKSKLVENHLLSASAVSELSDAQALDYIWHPGFSTAQKITDVSGRGVGMDVVKTRINQLNGTIELNSTPLHGTRFTIRLPLTLAIINSLLVRMRDVIFGMPIDSVREIVSVTEDEVVNVHGKQTIDVRGEFIPLVSIDDVFQWHDIDYGHHAAREIQPADSTIRSVDVVVLQAAGKVMGLRVDELLGGQDMVVKSLSDNFINIRGLSGASILGDGSVSLMLDVGTVIDMVTRPLRQRETDEMAK